MKTQIIETKRLKLRPLVLADAEVIEKYAGEKRVAEMTVLIPHPYPKGAAESWIAETLANPSPGGPFALTLKASGEFIGVMELSLCDDALRAEAGFWLGQPFWGQGFCTEALQAVIDYGFRDLNLLRIYAGHFSENPASGRVQKKAGMKLEGVHRMGAIRFGSPKDLVMLAITRPDWEVC